MAFWIMRGCPWSEGSDCVEPDFERMMNEEWHSNARAYKLLRFQEIIICDYLIDICGQWYLVKTRKLLSSVSSCYCTSMLFLDNAALINNSGSMDQIVGLLLLLLALWFALQVRS